MVFSLIERKMVTENRSNIAKSPAPTFYLVLLLLGLLISPAPPKQSKANGLDMISEASNVLSRPLTCEWLEGTFLPRKRERREEHNDSQVDITVQQQWPTLVCCQERSTRNKVLRYPFNSLVLVCCSPLSPTPSCLVHTPTEPSSKRAQRCTDRCLSF